MGSNEYSFPGEEDVPVDLWTYDFGPNKLMQRLRFVAGRLEEHRNTRVRQHAAKRRLRLASQRRICASSTGSGNEPPASTCVWNSRTSKRAPERALGLAAQRADADLAHLVRERLAGPRDVALDLGDDVGASDRGVGPHVVDGLLARPALRVQPGVDHEPYGSPDLHHQRAKLAVRVVVKPELATQGFGVQAPALVVGRELARGAGTAAARSVSCASETWK